MSNKFFEERGDQSVVKARIVQKNILQLGQISSLVQLIDMEAVKLPISIFMQVLGVTKMVQRQRHCWF
jgi:hypothetical protein